MNPRIYSALVFLLAVTLAGHGQKTVDQLKQEAASANGGQQARLYSELAEHMVAQAAEHFSRNDPAQGQATVKELLEYAARAHDIALNTHSKMKEVEIHLRQTQRHLENLKRSLLADDRPPIDVAEKQLSAERQDLLDTMFAPKKKDEGGKDEGKKDEPRKTETKKDDPKKDEPKKEGVKKEDSKKEDSKKEDSKKEDPK